MNDDKPVILNPFRKRDRLTGKRYRARWKASLAEIDAYQGEWVVDVPTETYAALGATSNFQIEKPSVLRDDRLQMHPQRETPPSIEQA